MVAVLGYHKIGPPPDDWWSWQYVPGGTFADQIALMREDGWEPISADELVHGLDAPDALPAKAFLVTFDDAYRSLRDDALQLLEELDLPAVVFAPTGLVGSWNSFDDGNEPREEICDWETLRQLAARGVSVQSHGVTHRAFSSLTVAECEDEATASRRAIEDRLGEAVTLLAYPYGDTRGDEELAVGLARAGYAAAFAYGGGAFELPPADRYKLPRIAMGPDTDLRAELGV
jgi:peptidoglycan/xylan/chitin deacetylase (PgdA/CDA1 family)